MLYQVMVIDPPWEVEKFIRAVRPNQVAFDYPTLSIPEMFKLMRDKIFPLGDKEGHSVFFWTTEKYLYQAIKQMTEHGYKKHCTFIWDKTNGIAPNQTIRFSHEYMIWFYTKLKPISCPGRWTTVFRESGREHSRKPNVAYLMIDQFYPDVQKLDVFSREKREGWSQWGNETEHFKT